MNLQGSPTEVCQEREKNQLVQQKGMIKYKRQKAISYQLQARNNEKTVLKLISLPPSLTLHTVISLQK